MDHEKSATGYLSRAAREVDDRRSTGRHAEYFGGDLVAVLAKAVVNGNTFEHVATRRVDVDGDIALTNSP
ncbi:hypothetical protein D3C79_1097000 [compost metagenome]